VADFPDATAGTDAAGINEDGEIVGFYGDAKGTYGFLAISRVPEPSLLVLEAIAAVIIGISGRRG
jgi:hypothetical protein